MKEELGLANAIWNYKPHHFFKAMVVTGRVHVAIGVWRELLYHFDCAMRTESQMVKGDLAGQIAECWNFFNEIELAFRESPEDCPVDEDSLMSLMGGMFYSVTLICFGGTNRDELLVDRAEKLMELAGDDHGAIMLHLRSVKMNITDSIQW